MSSPRNNREYVRNSLRSIAESTLSILITGSYVLYGKCHPLHIESSKQGTQYYPPDSLLSQWSLGGPSSFSEGTDVSFLEGTTLQGVHAMCSSLGRGDKLGVLNFASARRPGGGFLIGSQAQEESIARSSTLFPTLYTEPAQRFYDTHKSHPKDAFYTHAMIYSPRVHIFRDDQGHWTEPFVVDVLTSAAVNAGEVRAHARGAGSTEKEIEGVMRERMARILYLFELQGAKILVLGSFGTGVFRNEVTVVARIWAELLSAPQARFRRSFDRVLFAIIDKKTLGVFEHAYRQGSSSV